MAKWCYYFYGLNANIVPHLLAIDSPYIARLCVSGSSEWSGNPLEWWSCHMYGAAIWCSHHTADVPVATAPFGCTPCRQSGLVYSSCPSPRLQSVACVHRLYSLSLRCCLLSPVSVRSLSELPITPIWNWRLQGITTEWSVNKWLTPQLL